MLITGALATALDARVVNKYMRNTIRIIGIIAIVSIILFWAAKQDERRDKVYRNYEKCVMEGYGITPYAYYKINGKMPECI